MVFKPMRPMSPLNTLSLQYLSVFLWLRISTKMLRARRSILRDDTHATNLKIPNKSPSEQPAKTSLGDALAVKTNIHNYLNLNCLLNFRTTH